MDRLVGSIIVCVLLFNQLNAAIRWGGGWLLSRDIGYSWAVDYN